MNGQSQAQRMAEQQRESARRMAEQQERLRKMQEHQLELQRRNQEMAWHYEQTQRGAAAAGSADRHKSVPSDAGVPVRAAHPSAPAPPMPRLAATTPVQSPHRAMKLLAVAFSLVTLFAFAAAGVAVAHEVARSYRSDTAGFLAATPVWLAGLAVAVVGGRWLSNRG